MTDGASDLIKYKLERSAETLEEAKLMLQSSHLFGAANRVYYACFYAVSALLLSKNLSSPKHSGVLSLFNKHFVKTGLIQSNLASFIRGFLIPASKAITRTLLLSPWKKSETM